MRSDNQTRILEPRDVTTLLHRVCVRREPIKAVAGDMGIGRRSVERWVQRYEAREVRSEQAMQS